jgi:hypothetical protein
MTLFSRLFGRGEIRTVKKPIQRPFLIHRPIIGFLNLLGPRGDLLLEADRRALSPQFAESRVSSGAVPRAHVLFIYCDIGADGQVLGSNGAGLLDLIKSAGAHVAVVASENPSNNYKDSAPRSDGWQANIVFTLLRNGDNFSLFFQRLFAAMFNGTSMLMAWAQIAPQAAGPWMEALPSTYVLPRAGHIAFDSHSDTAGPDAHRM